MRKRELLHLHMLMFHIRMYCEGISHDEIRTEQYNLLGTFPLHIHKDKNAHKEALLTLGDEIVSHIHGPALPVGTCFHEAAILPLAGFRAKNAVVAGGTDPALSTITSIISSYPVESIEYGGIVHGNQAVLY